MSDSLRRSSRRNTRKPSDFNVGDVVEIIRNDQVFKGKLIYELSELSTKFPRWLVSLSKLDGTSWKEEELYEKDFKPWSDDIHTARPARSRSNPNSSIINGAPRKKTSLSGKNKSSSSSETEEPRTQKKAVAFIESPSPTAAVAAADSEADMSPKARAEKRAKASAREQRSKRRQAKVEDEVVQPFVHITTGPTTTKRMRAPTSNLPESKKVRKDEEVIKVPMLTGTLYLYRGPVRRAEFVRRF